jgi:hypothetical protein
MTVSFSLSLYCLPPAPARAEHGYAVYQYLGNHESALGTRVTRGPLPALFDGATASSVGGR